MPSVREGLTQCRVPSVHEGLTDVMSSAVSSSVVAVEPCFPMRGPHCCRWASRSSPLIRARSALRRALRRLVALVPLQGAVVDVSSLVSAGGTVAAVASCSEARDSSGVAAAWRAAAAFRAAARALRRARRRWQALFFALLAAAAGV